MKKIIIIGIGLLLCIPIYSQSVQAKKDDSIHILIQIEEAKDLYLLSIKDNTMKVQIISGKMYLPISCLNNDPSTINSVDFSNSYDCMINSLNKSLHLNIQYYANVKMKKLLKRLDLNKNTYDYKTLDSLCETGKKIKDKLSLSLVIDYQKYIDTNIDFETIYNLYKFFTKEKISIKYYTLSYFVINGKDIPMSTTFHLKKKGK